MIRASLPVTPRQLVGLFIVMKKEQSLDHELEILYKTIEHQLFSALRISDFENIEQLYSEGCEFEHVFKDDEHHHGGGL